MASYIFVEKERIEETLKMPHTPGKKELEPFKSFALANKLPYKIHEHPQDFGLAEIHLTEGDEWICLEGRVEFVVGGGFKGDVWILERDGVKNPNELRAKEIQNGEKVLLKPGDHLWIPAGIGHAHRGLGKARSLIYKIPVFAKGGV